MLACRAAPDIEANPEKIALGVRKKDKLLQPGNANWLFCRERLLKKPQEVWLCSR